MTETMKMSKFQFRCSGKRSRLGSTSIKAKIKSGVSVSRRPRQTPSKIRRIGRYSAIPSLQRRLLWRRIEDQFNRLTNEWKEQAEFLSSPAEMAMLPAYQRIIGMGRLIVPLILREMEREPHFWFWALRSITGEDPVPEKSRGQVQKMTEAWFRWAQNRNYQW